MGRRSRRMAFMLMGYASAIASPVVAASHGRDAPQRPVASLVNVDDEPGFLVTHWSARLAPGGGRVTMPIASRPPPMLPSLYFIAARLPLFGDDYFSKRRPGPAPARPAVALSMITIGALRRLVEGGGGRRRRVRGLQFSARRSFRDTGRTINRPSIRPGRQRRQFDCITQAAHQLRPESPTSARQEPGPPGRLISAATAQRPQPASSQASSPRMRPVSARRKTDARCQ